jgi:hypothetical protein
LLLLQAPKIVQRNVADTRLLGAAATEHDIFKVSRATRNLLLQCLARSFRTVFTVFLERSRLGESIYVQRMFVRPILRCTHYFKTDKGNYRPLPAR